jgi:hypothetical protein
VICGWAHRRQDEVPAAVPLWAPSGPISSSANCQASSRLPVIEPFSTASPETGLKTFDPFFYELPYPQELKDMTGLRDDERFLLDELVNQLQRVLSKIT